MRNMNLIFFVGLVGCFVNFHALGNVSMEGAIDLLRRELHFDFCGPRCNRDVALENIGMSTNRIIAISEKGYWDGNFRERQLFMLTRLEIAMTGKTSDKERRRRIADIRDMLITLKHDAVSSFVDRNRLVNLIEKVEYLLARVFEDSQSCLSKEDIEAILPDELFENVQNVFQRDFFKFKQFRKLLIAGVYVRSIQHTDTKTTDGIENISKEIERICATKGCKITFSVDGDKWQICSIAQNRSNSIRPFNIYVPLIRGHPDFKWPQKDDICLSSDFSAKRARLYHGERLNDKTPWECVMKRGRVYSRFGEIQDVLAD